MSVYEKLRVVRCPFSDKFMCKVGQFTLGITDTRDFVDFILERETDAYGEYGVARNLTDDETDKYLGMFRELAPDVTADELRIVEYCYYNCSEPPCYYEVK